MPEAFNGPDLINVVSIAPEPEFKLPPEREAEIYESSRKAGRRIADVLFTGVNMIMDGKAINQASEIEALKARVTRLEGVIERLERAIAPREVAWTGE